MVAPQEVCSAEDSCSTLSGGAGVSDADFVLFASSSAADSNLCSPTGQTLAFATWCQIDQHDRPTFAMANWCPRHVDTHSDAFDAQLSTAVHELAHALGFSSASFPLFRDDLGQPRTARDSNGRAPSRTFTCDGSERVVSFPGTGTATPHMFRLLPLTPLLCFVPHPSAFHGCADLVACVSWCMCAQTPWSTLPSAAMITANGQLLHHV